ncbi:MAG: hypothetical protein ACRYFZ_03730 [Janthinobacterium lividum]
MLVEGTAYVVIRETDLVELVNKILQTSFLLEKQRVKVNNPFYTIRRGSL